MQILYSILHLYRDDDSDRLQIQMSQKLNQIDQKIEENHVGLNLTMDVT